MKLELQDGDEKSPQYILLASENELEEKFIMYLRGWWTGHDR